MSATRGGSASLAASLVHGEWWATAMERRKDPITRSWVVIGKGEEPSLVSGRCRLCLAQETGMQSIFNPLAPEVAVARLRALDPS